jgi:hypothetical protein
MDSKKRKAFIIRELSTIRSMFHVPHYQINKKVQRTIAINSFQLLAPDV